VKQGKVVEEYERLNGVRNGSVGKRSLDGQNVRPTKEDIAKEFGVDTRMLRRLKQLTRLIPEVQSEVAVGYLGIRQAITGGTEEGSTVAPTLRCDNATHSRI
jgi:hypothetical protein